MGLGCFWGWLFGGNSDVVLWFIVDVDIVFFFLFISVEFLFGNEYWFKIGVFFLMFCLVLVFILVSMLLRDVGYILFYIMGLIFVKLF